MSDAIGDVNDKPFPVRSMRAAADALAEHAGRVRPCDIDVEDGWCHAHRMYCTLAAKEAPNG